MVTYVTNGIVIGRPKRRESEKMSLEKARTGAIYTNGGCFVGLNRRVHASRQFQQKGRRQQQGIRFTGAARAAARR